MFQGTGSDVGKSVLVAGLCRALKRRGKSVLPFKPQNMSNNAAIAEDGTEIGRAQALQARACGVKPQTDMNPVLLKPQSDIGAQLIVNGEVKGNYNARDYQALKPNLLPEVIAAFNRLRAEADIVLVEGAGSASEINLRDGDIANMGFATATQTPVILIGDIDRGGVIASITGTHALLPEDEKKLLKGYLINKFRGDVSLFDNAINILGDHTGLPCFGIVPYLQEAAALPAEDSVVLETTRAKTTDGTLKIAVPRLLHIANFDDLDPLIAESDVTVVMVPPGSPLPGDADLIILPGTKATIPALNHFRDQGWDIDLAAHIRRGGHVLGICGGYQILGNAVDDPNGTEGPAGKVPALSHLDVETTIAGPKTLTEIRGDAWNDLGSISGFEMHMGQTTGTDTAKPFLDLGGRPDGAINAGGTVIGCYIHGLFAEDDFRHAFLNQLQARERGIENFQNTVERALDAIAEQLEDALDIDGLLKLAANQ
jgi:adenosylcobyric acid synthase